MKNPNVGDLSTMIGMWLETLDDIDCDLGRDDYVRVLVDKVKYKENGKVTFTAKFLDGETSLGTNKYQFQITKGK